MTPQFDRYIVIEDLAHGADQQVEPSKTVSWSVASGEAVAADAWTAAVQLCGASSALGVFVGTSSRGRGVVFSSGLSKANLKNLNPDGLRRWCDDNMADQSPERAEIMAVLDKAGSLGTAIGLSTLGRLGGMLVARIPAQPMGTFYLLLSGVSQRIDRDTELQPFISAGYILLQIAVTHIQSERSQNRLSAFEGLFHDSAAPTFLLNKVGQVLWTNSAAHQEMATQQSLFRADDGRLSVADAAETARFQAEIAKMMLPQKTEDSEVPANRFVKVVTGTGAHQLLLIHPIRGLAGKKGPSFALAIFSDPDHVWSFEATTAFFEAVGLLPSEARFASALLQKGNVAEAAIHLGLSLQTGQTYLKRIFPKIGVKSQLELALFAAGALPSLRRQS